MCYTVIKSLLPVLNTFNFLFALFFPPPKKARERVLSFATALLLPDGSSAGPEL